MLGLYRYILAMMVACSHLWNELMWWQGNYAVFSFYVISGYLMCFILKEVYLGLDGAKRYAVNRLLRIYPLYLLIFALAIIFRVSVKEVPQDQGWFNFIMTVGVPFPDMPVDWLGNITLLFPWDTKLTIGQGWSLRVELIFYALMIILARRLWIVVIWFMLSLVWIIHLDVSDALYVTRYTTVHGASIAFSGGALIYYMRQRWLLASWHLPLATLLYFIHLWFAPELWNFDRQGQAMSQAAMPGHFGLYGSVALTAYLLWAIMSMKRQKNKLDRFGNSLGNYAYSIFLSHQIVAGMVMALGVRYTDKPVFLLTAFIIVNGFAIILYYGFERPINRRIRDKVRVQSPP